MLTSARLEQLTGLALDGSLLSLKRWSGDESMHECHLCLPGASTLCIWSCGQGMGAQSASLRIVWVPCLMRNQS